ncbi:MAG TPA: PHP-associated domain-containing protein [Candidatus Dormibacteraeota bacterium]
MHRLHPELAIAGEEIKTREGEVIGLFLTEQVKPWLRPEETLDLIHEQGGLTYLAHPCDRYRSSFSPERVMDLAPRVDIVETYNAWARPADNQLAAELCRELGKVAATGSDAHAPSELGLSWMEMEEYEGAGDFLEKLRRARHVVTELSGTQRRA